MNGILITGGELPDFEYVKDFFKGESYICAADSGFDWAVKNNILCDIVVGDMDSIVNENELYNKEHQVRLFDVDKDDTDTHIGLEVLKSKTLDKIILIGGGGGRLDHLLGVFSFFESSLYPDLWITKREKVLFIDKKTSLKNYRHSKLSVFPVGEVRCSILSYGLKWELDQVDWKFKSIGISNEIIGNNSWIDPGDNRVIVILPITGKKFE